ncbi:MAG: response regulator [Lachnospiraceae bacterium]|nr:response regulator [Lachnospiraceae bacterium]
MGFLVNVGLIIAGTWCISAGVSFSFREKRSGNRYRFFILFLGIAAGIWNYGYAIMGMNFSPYWIRTGRMIGLFGCLFYIMWLIIMLSYVVRIKRIFRNLMIFIQIPLGIWDVIAYTNPKHRDFFWQDGRTAYVNNGTYIEDTLHGIYIALCFLVVFIIAIVWLTSNKTREGKTFVRVSVYSHLIMMLSIIPDTVLPKMGYPSFPSSCLGVAVTYLIVWHTANSYNGFSVTVSNVSNSIFETSNLHILVYDLKQNLCISNKSAQKFFHIRSKRARLYDLFEMSEKEANILFNSALNESVRNYRAVTRVGGVNVSLAFGVARQKHNVPYGIIMFVQDMTKEAEMMKELESANKAKSEFLANMSHEIRTPINAVLGMNELIIRESTEPYIVSYAQDVKSSGRILLSLINDILDFSKIESGKMDIIPVEYELASLINDIINMMTPRAQDKKLEFRVDIDEELPVGLIGDEIRIRQIIMNLVSNAIKYTEKGWVSLKMAFEKTEGGIELIIEVADSGKGIRKEDQARLFNSFTRVDEVKNRTIEGTGLGLALTKSFVEMMGGTLGFESTYGKGSTFSVKVTQGVSNDSPIGDFSKKIKQNKEKSGKTHSELYAPGAKVLVVDDVDMNCKVFMGLLKNSGMDIDKALSGREAIGKCKEKRYDLIFMDHRMPVMDGVECFHILRKMDTPNKNTPVVILTANALSGAREEYVKEGFDEFLGKPIEIKYLENTIRKFLPDFIKQKPSEAAEANDKKTGIEYLPIQYPGLNIELGLSYCMKDAEFYHSMLEEFVNSDKSEVIAQSLNDGNYEDFGTYVHAVKSSALTIGAEELSSKAKKLEAAAKQQDKEYIDNNYADFAQDYQAVIQMIKNPVEIENKQIDNKAPEDNAVSEENVSEKAKNAEAAKASEVSDKKMKEELMQFIIALSKTIEAKDRYTRGHSERVAQYSREIAKRMGFSEDEQEEIYIVGLLHDLGKIHIPEGIINKVTPLTEDDETYIHLHPNAGYHILKDIESVPNIAYGARFHHERFDGSGYPAGISGKDIPETARIIAVADAYDAMASARAYRGVLPQEVVRNEIEKGRGTQFDPDIADIMLQMIDEDTEYNMRQPDVKVKNILVIDDEKMNRMQVKHHLKGDSHFQLLEASSGMEGVNMVITNDIDLVLLDIRMPELDGFATLEMIRAVSSNIPVIFLTADNDIETITRATMVGVKDYLVKPVMKNALLDMIKNALNLMEV